MMFYDRFVKLCEEKGVSPSRAAVDAGLSKSTVSKWKQSPDSRPTGSVIHRLTAYFGVSVAQLLGENENESDQTVRPVIREEDIKFALFGGDGEITDAMYDEVRSFAAFVKQREAAKNQGKE